MSEIQKWQPIETAPKNGESVLAWDGEDMEKIHFNKYEKGWVVDSSCDVDDEWKFFYPTRWMPLPEAPEC
jgi:hypothetical protein